MIQGRKSWFLVVLTITSLLLFTTSAHPLEFDLKNGDVSVNFTQHNPINVNVVNLKSGDANLQFVTTRYKSKVKVGTGEDGEGLVNIDKTILASQSDIEAVVKDGELYYEISSSSSKNSILLKDGSIELKSTSSVHSNKEPNTKQVATSVEASGESGKVTINYDNDGDIEINRVTNIANKLGVNRQQARNFLNNHSFSRVNYALEKAGRSGKLNGNSLSDYEVNQNGKVAGGAGSVAGGAASINNLSPSSMFQVYLEGPAFQATFKDSTFFMRLHYPGNGLQLKDLPTNITVSGPKRESSNNVILIDNLNYSNEHQLYYYEFKKTKWLVGEGNLRPGKYILHIDLGPSLSKKIGITITEDHKVVQNS